MAFILPVDYGQTAFRSCRDRVAHERGSGQPEQACAAKPSGPSRSRTSNTPRQFGAAWIARADPVTHQGPTPAMLSGLQRLSNER